MRRPSDPRSASAGARRRRPRRSVDDLELLSARNRGVLQGVLREYVRTGQPVGSRALAASLQVSSATVRGTMSELMALGLLSQSHASAGRAPTDRAFRLWVDALLEPAIEHEQRVEVGRLPVEPGGDLRRAADLLSAVTGQVGFFVGPETGHVALERLHFVRVSSERVMAVLISGAGVVHSRLLEESELDARVLEQVTTRLSAFVSGRTLEQARRALADEIARERAQSNRLWRALQRLGEASLAATEVELYVGDPLPLLRQLEFADVEELLALLSALEEKERMLQLLNKIVHSDPVRVVIGEELDDPGVRRCAVVTAQLGTEPEAGGLGVIGPVRMRYDRVIPLVRYVSERAAVATD